jgi:ribonuclease VapC
VTIAVDSSALSAIVFGEPDAEGLLSVLLANVGDIQLSAASLVEASIVVEARQGPEAAADLRLLCDRLGILIVPVDEDQAHLAAAGWRRFGRRRHPAGLNLGDCFAYALSKASSAPLLFKGHDFPQTDVASVL